MDQTQFQNRATPPSPSDRQRPIALAFLYLCSGLLIIVGVAVLIGWAIHNQALTTILPGRASMKPNTALCFLAEGIALFLSTRSTTAATSALRVVAALVWLCAAASLAEYIFHADLHIDQLFFPDYNSAAFPGRMAPITAVNFCLSATALLLLQGNALARRIGQIANFALIAFAFAAIVGYVYNVPLFYGSFNYRSMAFHTGIAFLIAGCGIATTDVRSTLMRVLRAPQAGSWSARRLLPLVIIAPVLLGWVFLRPAINFGRPAFGMALLAVTLVLTGSTALITLALFQNRAEREKSDIDRQQIETARTLSQRDRDLRLVTEQLPSLLSYIDIDGRFVRVNQRYEAWLGLRAIDLIGKTVRETLGDDYWQRTAPMRLQAAAGASASMETVYPTLSGERQVQVTYAPDFDLSGKLIGFACMVLDIDERRRTEAALRQSEKLAVVGRMASSIAHEINNPLESVTNLLYLARTTDDTSEVRAYLETAELELRRASAITAQTLRFHKQLSSPTLITCEELIAGVLAIHQGRLLNSTVTVEMRKRSTAPIKCFEGEIRQVLSNLVGNAIDSMQLHGGRLLVRSRQAPNPKSGDMELSITIADTGTGMSAATLEKIRQPFFTTKGFSGTGLGLWISQEIIDRHQGSLTVRSSQRPGHCGTVCVLKLPFNAAER